MFHNGLFPKFRSWLQNRLHRSARPRSEEKPLVRLRGLVQVIASHKGAPLKTFRLALDGVNLERLRCKGQEFFEEGAQLNLEFMFQEQPVALKAVVERFDISGVAHTSHLRILHTEQSRAIWKEFLYRLQCGEMLVK